MTGAADRRYEPGLDWLKAIGIILIVHGHVAARTVEWATPPFYPKQVGVALFVFATGFTLAREHRPTITVLRNRLFEIILVGALCAGVMSGIGLVLWNDPAESNYLPLLGLHVLLGDLPANPTTWYIGTYLHLLLLWAVVLRGREWIADRAGWIFVAGILVRAFLILTVGPHRAYMAIFNWIDVLLLGMKAGAAETPVRPLPRVLAVLAVLAWPLGVGVLHWVPAFPFMTLAEQSPAAVVATSAMVSAGYVLFTWTAWALCRAAAAPAWVGWLSRNTVVVVVAHMPVYYLLEAWLTPLIPSFAPRATLEMIICLPGLAAVSAALRPGLQSLRGSIAR